jgi:hypothetical protein
MGYDSIPVCYLKKKNQIPKINIQGPEDATEIKELEVKKDDIENRKENERQDSNSSFYSIRYYAQCKKERFKKFLDDPENKKLIFDKKFGCISGFSAYTFKNFK